MYLPLPKMGQNPGILHVDKLNTPGRCTKPKYRDISYYRGRYRTQVQRCFPPHLWVQNSATEKSTTKELRYKAVYH
jgi:hypothetical protein